MEKNMIDQIIRDIMQTHIILNAEAGHGKSTSLMTIIQQLKQQNPETIIKVFDVSQAWFHRAPLTHRQRIGRDTDFENIPDCVYETGALTEDERRLFVASIIRQDYDQRRDAKYDNPFVKFPRAVYVFEEADTYFDSASLNKKDEASATLRDFIKVGRNFGMRAFCVATAAVGELGTKLRRRSKHLIGKILSDSDYREYNRKSKGLGGLALELPRFTWIYFNGQVSEPFRIPDLTEKVPEDYIIVAPEPVVQFVESQDLSEYTGWAVRGRRKPVSRGVWFLGGLVVGVLLPILWLISVLGF